MVYNIRSYIHYSVSPYIRSPSSVLRSTYLRISVLRYTSYNPTISITSYVLRIDYVIIISYYILRPLLYIQYAISLYVSTIVYIIIISYNIRIYIIRIYDPTYIIITSYVLRTISLRPTFYNSTFYVITFYVLRSTYYIITLYRTIYYIIMISTS